MTLQMAYDEKYREGLETGIQRGRENGIAEEKEETARRMLSDNTLTLDQIASFTGLSMEQILILKKSI